MFGWMQIWRAKPSKEELLLKQALDLLDAYGDLLETRNSIVSDASILPASKERIAAACKIALIAAKSDEARDAVEMCWSALSHFQQGVGAPDVHLPDADTVLTDQGGQSLERAYKWLAVANEEMARRRVEIDAFKLHLSKARP